MFHVEGTVSDATRAEFCADRSVGKQLIGDHLEEQIPLLPRRRGLPRTLPVDRRTWNPINYSHLARAINIYLGHKSESRNILSRSPVESIRGVRSTKYLKRRRSGRVRIILFILDHRISW